MPQNWALLNRDTLDLNHYTMQADPARQYFFNLRPSVLDQLLRRQGERFCIVIIGDEAVEGDFYVLPFSRVAHAFTSETLTPVTSNNPGRWLGRIPDGTLHVYPGEDAEPVTVPVADCHGRRDFIAEST